MRVVLAIIAGGLLLIAAAFGIACSDDDNGGGDTLTLEDYFAQAAELRSGTSSAFQELAQMEGPSADDSDEDIATFLHANVQGSAEILRDAESDFHALDAPEEAADAHDAFVLATGDAAGALEDYDDALPDSLTLEGLENAPDPFFSDQVLEDAFLALEDACMDLQTVADDNGIAVDLECAPE